MCCMEDIHRTKQCPLHVRRHFIEFVVVQRALDLLQRRGLHGCGTVGEGVVDAFVCWEAMNWAVVFFGKVHEWWPIIAFTI